MVDDFDEDFELPNEDNEDVSGDIDEIDNEE